VAGAGARARGPAGPAGVAGAGTMAALAVLRAVAGTVVAAVMKRALWW
jgi:hypothetical protein